MKPIKLIIEGINSFTDAQELDFEAVGRSNLFCICGKTGAGKTTIFDSIMLALYGKSGKGNLADTVNLSRKSGTVVFEFEAGGDRYRVERTIKCREEKNEKGETVGRKGAMYDCMLYKNGEPHAKGSDEISVRIEELIGLAEGEFKNVYLLEQGEYAEFLKKPPAKQLETVGKIFSLMRFGDVHKLANEKMKEADALKAATEGRIADQGDITADGVRAAKSELATVKTKRKSLSIDIETRKKELDELGALRDLYLAALEKQKAVAEHAKRLDDAKERLKAAAAAEEAFRANDAGVELEARHKELDEKLNGLSALNVLDRECENAALECDRKRADLDKTREAVSNLETESARKEQAASADKQAFDGEIEAFGKTAAGIANPSDALSRAVSALRDNATANTVTSCYYELCAEKNKYDDLIKDVQNALGLADKLDSNAADELKKTETYVEELDRAEQKAEEARAAERKAEEELSAAYLASHAAAISAELHAGDVCPVCGGTYHGGAHVGADVEAKKKEKDEAESVREKAEAQVVELKNKVERSNIDYDRISREAEENRKKAAGFEEQAVATGVKPDIYRELTTVLERAKSSGERKEKSEKECADYAPKLATARAELDSADKAFCEAEQKAKELADRLGDMRGRTGAEIEKVKSEISAIEKQASELDKRRRELATEKDAAVASVATFEEVLAAARRDCPAEMPEFDDDAYRAKKEAAADIEKRLHECDMDIARREEALNGLEQRLEKLKSLKAELEGYIKRSDRYKTIADMTKGKAMLNFVAIEYIQGFTATASDILGSLSGGKYSMRYEGENGFVVSDYLNDGKTRKTDTLSGGEMFLASLAVAIAIAREQSAGDNAFFFLDEGFGTLDDELIDTVYGALEELARNCLVGVISHSNALIDRMPSKVEVIEATDTVGSRIQY